MRKLLVSLVVMLVLIGGLLIYGWYYYTAPGPLPAESTVIFKRGEGFRAIVEDLGQSGVVSHPWLFKTIAIALGDARKFKAGEYDFSAAISPKLVMDMIAAGRVVVHKVTIPEGLTVRQIAALLTAEKALEGDISGDIAEGSLLPETYHFVYGDLRQELLHRMQVAMSNTLAQLWAKRQEGLPFDSPQQALVLASIVEKETGIASERPRVAAVFINRLQKHMRLQSDPTVTYGLEKQNGAALGRALTLADLHQTTPYNTYVIDGLPPTPIANPGRASLEAVLHPAPGNDLYFVATGNGGHNFAGSLKEHNQNVQRYHHALNDQRKKTP